MMDTGCGEKPCPICGNLTHEDVTELDTLRKDNKRLRDALENLSPCPICGWSAKRELEASDER